MHPRLQDVADSLDREMALLRAEVDAIPPRRREERPAPDRWSVAEVLEHLALVENSVLKACERQLAAARETGLAAETDTTPILSTMPLAEVASRERRLVSPERLAPKTNDAAAAWRQIEEVRARFLAFVATCDGLALADVSFPHPALGPLNLYQWLLFAAGHHARHAAQIREICEQLSAWPPRHL